MLRLQIRLWPASAVGALVAGGIVFAAAEAPLPPPLPGPLLATSSFGEYRSGHYHGGLDFSTGGREGLPVLAPGAGRVSRLRASGVGYGKAVYFRLEDGRTVVYAHLSRFHPRIERSVVEVQDRLGRFEVDFVPSSPVLAFGVGDTLAYTGQSGAGPPHLHAEIRMGDEAAVAVNPWLRGWAPIDTIAPSVPRLRVEPAAPGVLVDGGTEAAVIPLRTGSSPAAVSVTGPVRLWVEAWDAGAGGARLAPYRVRAVLDGEEIASITLDEVDWNRAREVLWTYHAARARDRNERWMALDPPPGGRLGITRMKERWWQALEPGSHRLEILAEDASGNRARGECLLRREEPDGASGLQVPVPAPFFTSRGGWLEWSRPPGDGSPGLRAIAPDGVLVDVEPLRIAGPNGGIHQWGRPEPAMPGLWTFLSGDSLLGRAVWVPGAGGEMSLGDFIPWKRDPDSVTADLGGLRLSIPGDGTYGPLWIAVRTGRRIPSAPAGSGLEALEAWVELEPHAAPLRRDLVAQWAAPVGRPEGLAVMRRGGEAWGFVGARIEGDGVGGSVGVLETLILVRDTEPPGVRIQAVSETSRRPRIRALIDDAGTGVAWSDLVMRLDGHPVIAEWDPDAGSFAGHLRAPLAPGLHSLSVEASDRAGNRASRSLTFTTR